MTTTTQLRSWWAPACQGPWSRVALFGDGAVSVRPAIVDAVGALSACLEAFGYRSRAADTGAYNCRTITGGTGYSLHAYGIAIDINWQSNPYGPTLITDMPGPMIDAILRLRTRNGQPVWRWGGNYAGNKDAMHFEIVCDPADLGTGIDPTTLPQSAPPPLPEDDMTPEQSAKLDRIEQLLTEVTIDSRDIEPRSKESTLILRDLDKRIAAIEAKLG